MHLQHNYYNLSHMPVESWEVDVSGSAWPPASEALERETETWPAVQHRSHETMMPPEVVPAGLEHIVLCCSAVKRLWCLGGPLVHVMLTSRRSICCAAAQFRGPGAQRRAWRSTQKHRRSKRKPSGSKPPPNQPSSALQRHSALPALISRPCRWLVAT